MAVRTEDIEKIEKIEKEREEKRRRPPLETKYWLPKRSAPTFVFPIERVGSRLVSLLHMALCLACLALRVRPTANDDQKECLI